jgi:sugar lactone lactonase YvrE
MTAEKKFARTLRSVLALASALTVAGCGGSKPTEVFGPGPGGAATRTKLAAPEALLLDAKGNLYLSEFEGARVVKIAPDGRLTVVAGTGTAGNSGDGGRAVAARIGKPTGLAFDSRGNLAISDYANSVIRSVDPAGVISTLDAGTLSQPIGLVFNADNLFIADAGAGEARVKEIATSGEHITVVKGVDPAYLVVDRARNLDLADADGNVVSQIGRDAIVSGGHGSLSTIAGTGKAGFGGDGGPALEARFNRPYGLAIDHDGNVYVSDRMNNRVRKIDPEGIITTVVGTGARGFGGDGGPATAAKLDQPVGLAIDSANDLYIADSGNDRVRRVDAHGVITTVAGDGR